MTVLCLSIVCLYASAKPRYVLAEQGHMWQIVPDYDTELFTCSLSIDGKVMFLDRLKIMYPLHSPPTSNSNVFPFVFFTLPLTQFFYLSLFVIYIPPSFQFSAAIGSESFIKHIIKNAHFCSFCGRILNKRGTAEDLLRENTWI